MAGSRALQLAMATVLSVTVHGVIMSAQDTRTAQFRHKSVIEAGSCVMRPECGFDSYPRSQSAHGALPAAFVSLSRLPCMKQTLASSASSLRRGVLARIQCACPKLTLRMTTAQPRKSKMLDAIHTAETKKNEMVVWNDELLVWYAREKDAAARQSKSFFRRFVETIFHLFARVVAILCLQFWGCICSTLRYAQKLRPDNKAFEVPSPTSELPSAAIEAAQKEAAKEVAQKEAEVAELETVKLGFSKPATAKELAVMKEMRTRIAALTAEETKGMSVVWLERLQREEMGYELLSYVRKARGKPQVCLESILKSAEWRTEFGVEGILEEKDLTIEGFFLDMTREVDWLPAHADIAGEQNPVLLYRSAAHVPLDIPTERWLRFFVHHCEAARLAHPQKQVAILVDRVGSGRKNQDPTVLRALSPIIAEHFPLLIGRVYIAPVNTVLFIIWRLVSLILDEETKKTIQLVQGESWKMELVKVVEPSTLPVRLGGQNEDY